MHFNFWFNGDVGNSGLKDYTWIIYRNKSVNADEDKEKSNGNAASGTNVVDHKRWEWSQGEDTSEGEVYAKMILYDNAGNKKVCETEHYYIDRTSPTISNGAAVDSIPSHECDFTAEPPFTCKLHYTTSKGFKFRVKNPSSGNGKYSPLETWGAQTAVKECTGSGCECNWGDVEWRWNGEACCNKLENSKAGSRVKRCYVAKDAAENKSDLLCSCQEGQTITGPFTKEEVNDSTNCFSGRGSIVSDD